MKTTPVTDREQQRVWRKSARHDEEWFQLQQKAKQHEREFRFVNKRKPQIQPWMLPKMIEHAQRAQARA